MRSFTLVGVDEASVAEGRVAFSAPIARAIQGARLGQQVRVPPAETVEITAIRYQAEAQ